MTSKEALYKLFYNCVDFLYDTKEVVLKDLNLLDRLKELINGGYITLNIDRVCSQRELQEIKRWLEQ